MAKRLNHPIPKKGKIFTKVYNNKKHSMKTVEVDGKIKYKVDDIIFNTPTAAAKHITKNSVNGWVFWDIVEKPAYHRKKK
jgi:hypothetical protein